MSACRSTGRCRCTGGRRGFRWGPSGTEDPYELCASAVTRDACEAIDVAARSDIQLPFPSCQWRDVYTLDTTAGCELLSTEARCILYFGYEQGCGFGPGCLQPGLDGPKRIRHLDATTELIFYPMDEICGPSAAAPPDEPQWIDCEEPSDPACECICDLIR